MTSFALQLRGVTGVPFFPSQTAALFPPLLDQTHRDWLSTGFLIYGPLYKKGLGTQHSLSYDIESRLPSMEMRVVCYCVKAYLHCAVKLSLVTTACLLTLALKFIFACRAVWFRHVRDIFGEKVQRRQIAFTLTGSCVCPLLQCTYEPLNTYKPPFAKRRLCTRPMKRCMLCLVKFHRRNRQYIVHFNQVI